MRAGNAGFIKKGGGWTEGVPQLSEMMIKVGYGALQDCKSMQRAEGLRSGLIPTYMLSVFLMVLSSDVTAVAFLKYDHRLLLHEANLHVGTSWQQS